MYRETRRTVKVRRFVLRKERPDIFRKKEIFPGGLFGEKKGYKTIEDEKRVSISPSQVSGRSQGSKVSGKDTECKELTDRYHPFSTFKKGHLHFTR